jgi:hypothetical protein
LNRQQRRRIEREWNKIALGESCTEFVGHNSLFMIPYVVVFQAVKIGLDLICVYSIGLFKFKEGFGFMGNATVCHFVSSLFWNLGSINVGYVCEESLDFEEEIESEL